MSLAPSTPTSLSKRPRENYTPDKYGNVLSADIVSHWGNCFKCNQPGHFARDCTFRSRVFQGKYDTTCPLCGDCMQGKECVYEDSGVMCARCRVGQNINHHEKRRRMLTFEDEVAHGPTAEETDQQKVRKCVECSDDHIGVVARAGTGKTHLIVTEAKRAKSRGERVLGLTLNKDAAFELKSRGLTEARTFHSLGFAAWRRAQGEGVSVVGSADEAIAEDDGEARESAAKKARVPDKSKLLLRQLYPRAPDAPRRVRLSLEVALFESFVVELVAFAKALAVGIPDPDGSDPYPNTRRTWEELEAKFGSGKLIEYTLKKKLSTARRKEADGCWPTAVTRLQAGIGLAREVFKASIKCATSSSWQGVSKLYMSDSSKKAHSLPLIDYGDMLYMPLHGELPFDPAKEDEPGLAWLYVDEAQDTDRARRLVCSSLLDENSGDDEEVGARLFAVGDDMQALYGFSGADTDALAHLFNAFSCKQFPLPVCRRCPTSHVDLANGVIEKVDGGVLMQPLDGALAGTIHRDADFVQFPLESRAVVTRGPRRHTSPQENSRVIIARRNAPLLAMLYCLAARGIACRMAGRDQLAKKLKKTVDELRRQSEVDKDAPLAQLVHELPAYVQRQQAARVDSDEEAEDCSIQDVADCIETVVQQLHERSATPTVEDLLDELKQRFSSANKPMPPDVAREATELSTVHKAKGREWMWVYILQPKELPLPYVVAGGGWQARQEHNVEYVALTRSKLHLVFLRNLELDGSGASIRRALDGLLAPESAGGMPRCPAEAEHGHWNDTWRRYWGERRQEEQQPTGVEWEAEDGEEASMSAAEARTELGLPALPNEITRQEVHKAFRAKAKYAHPDRVSRKLVASAFTAAIVNAEAKMKLVSLAREVLSRELALE